MKKKTTKKKEKGQCIGACILIGALIIAAAIYFRPHDSYSNDFTFEMPDFSTEEELVPFVELQVDPGSGETVESLDPAVRESLHYPPELPPASDGGSAGVPSPQFSVPEEEIEFERSVNTWGFPVAQP